MSAETDRELERLFRDARTAEANRAPSFTKVMARRATPRSQRALWPAFAGSFALIAIIALWRLTATSPIAFDIRPGDLRVPTDYLLEIVSIPRAGEIPRVGLVDWFPLEPSANNRREQ